MDSFIGWIGGKKALRDKIINEFPSEVPTRYIEVFGGAGWVLFRKENTVKQLEVYNDIDSNLVNLFRVIKFHREEFLKEFDSMFLSRETFNNFKEQLDINGLTDIQRAVRYFYLIRVSFGSNKRSFGTAGRKFSSSLNRLEEIQKRLSNVIIENRDFEKLIKTYDREGALFYLDPPYHETEKYYKNGTTFTQSDHIRLCNCLQNIKGKFILSYNDDSFIRGLYKDFNIIEVSRKNTLSPDNTKEFKEVIIKNY